ncbi:hypothetical protein FRC02_012280 [Tulasnella sp. 418]|nr:hypothetical protein FRC02_012280 [Tulasnella sp. 418]
MARVSIPSSSKQPRSLPKPTSPTPSDSSSSLAPLQTSLPHVDDEVIFLNPDGSPYTGRHVRRTLDTLAMSPKGKRRLDDTVPDLHARYLEESKLSEYGVSRRQSNVAYPSCDNEGNEVLSCYPTADTTVQQGNWTKFIWNARYPEFIGNPGQVDIYLYHADSGAEVNRWMAVPNVRSEINVVINDSFWDYRAADFSGSPTPYTYYFVVTKAGRAITGGEPKQATWTAIQWRQPDSVISASKASVTSMASVSAISTASLTSMLSSVSMSSVSATASAGLQGSMANESNDKFPSWAIALLVVLGFLALVSMAGLFYLLIRNFRRQNGESDRSRRESMGSSSPMMANQPPSENPHSPMTQTGHSIIKGPPLGYASGGGLTAVADPPSSLRFSNVNDGASTRTMSDKGLISGQDAAIVADAFRQKLRKPDFAEGLEEGESPESRAENGEEPDVISRELAEEGRDIRSVSSGRGVRIHSLEEEDGRSTPTHRR